MEDDQLRLERAQRSIDEFEQINNSISVQHEFYSKESKQVEPISKRDYLWQTATNVVYRWWSNKVLSELGGNEAYLLRG